MCHKVNGMFLIVAMVCYVVVAQAVTIETVPVGDPGNVGEWCGLSYGYGGYGPDRICGAVDYTYNIGKYEVTAGQYTAFLNAVGGVDTYVLYNTDMCANRLGQRDYADRRRERRQSYIYTVAADFANRPVNYVSWGDAARFANWLHNGQPTGCRGFDNRGRCILSQRRDS